MSEPIIPKKVEDFLPEHHKTPEGYTDEEFEMAIVSAINYLLEEVNNLEKRIIKADE